MSTSQKCTSKSSTSERDPCRLLGVNWDSSRDELTFEFSGLIQEANELPKTKRSDLRLTASVFDPLGLLSPFVINLKVLFQRLCTSQINWDESLSSDLVKEWGSITSDLEEFNKLKVPRGCILADYYPVSVCLHGFVMPQKQCMLLFFISPPSTQMATFRSGYFAVRLEWHLLLSKQFLAWNY